MACPTQRIHNTTWMSVSQNKVPRTQVLYRDIHYIYILIHITCHHISIIYSLSYIGNSLEMQHLFAIIVSIYPFDMEHLYSVVKVNQILSEYPSTLGSTIICRICLMTWKCNILCFYHIDTSIEYKGFVFF